MSDTVPEAWKVAEEVWGSMRVPGSKFWHELPTDMQVLALQSYSRGKADALSTRSTPTGEVTEEMVSLDEAADSLWERLLPYMQVGEHARHMRSAYEDKVTSLALIRAALKKEG